MPKMRIVYDTSLEDVDIRDCKYDTSETPVDELTNGIQQILISNYGDDHTSAFVKVVAISDEIGITAYNAIRKSLTDAVFNQWYGVV